MIYPVYERLIILGFECPQLDRLHRIGDASINMLDEWVAKIRSSKEIDLALIGHSSKTYLPYDWQSFLNGVVDEYDLQRVGLSSEDALVLLQQLLDTHFNAQLSLYQS